MKDYTGGDSNSELAYFSKDISGPENEDVFVEDFVWNRGKSNENLTNMRQGKGFSFYYARHAFEDEDCLHIFDIENLDNTKSLGIIFEKVVIVINCINENNKIRIISAWEDNDTILSDIYWKNKKRNDLIRAKGTKRESIKYRNQNARFTSEVDKNEVFNFVNRKRLERLLENVFNETTN